MATLNSPGVSVTVIDESFYVPGAPGTVPLVVVASAQDKTNAAGTIAPGTLKSNAGKVYLLTSQKDLSDTFGTPMFQVDAENNPIHASEINEYGLQAAYSLLGVSNRAYVVRADIDLDALAPSGTSPAGPPADGTLWLNTANTQWGVFQWQAGSALSGGQSFYNQQTANNLKVITNSAYTVLVSNKYAPVTSYGAIGDYAIVSVTSANTLWYKKPATNTAAGTWVEVGTPAWAASWPTVTSTIASGSVTFLNTDVITVNSTAVTTGLSLTTLATAINGNSTLTTAGISAAVVGGFLQIYSTGVSVALANSNGTPLSTMGVTAGTYIAPELTISPHTSVPVYDAATLSSTVGGAPTGSIWVKTTSPNAGANYFVNKYSASTSQWTTLVTNLYANNQSALAALDPTGGGINLAAGAIYVKYNTFDASPAIADFTIFERLTAGPTITTSSIIGSSTLTSGTNTFTISESAAGNSNLVNSTTVSFTAAGTSADANTLAAAISAQLPVGTNISVQVNSNNSITLTHMQGGEIYFIDGTNTPITKLFVPGTATNFYNAYSGTTGRFVATLWQYQVAGSGLATPSETAPTTVPATNTLWYDSSTTDVDIMINDGTKWVGYLTSTSPYYNSNASQRTDANGPIISATQPTTQSNGSQLQNGDLWIDSSDLEHFPKLYKWNYLSKVWVAVNNADHTSPNGIIFADARWTVTGANATGTPDTIQALLISNFVDFDCPSPTLYPKGMLLWNTRRSSFNVKKYVRNYINPNSRNPNYNNQELMTNYFSDRWVTASANQADGSGSFGRHSQRQIVVTAMKALIESSQAMRDEESLTINLLAAPGYTELIPDLVSLSTDRGQDCFVVADAPARLTPDATSLYAWGSNAANAASDGEKGLLTTSSNLGVYYPWGYATDNLGNNIVVPPSHMMLRTIALSDQVSYPWYAPAGTRRGIITNATSAGYVDATGEFQAVSLNTGQRDTLASVHVNPITYLAGVGLVAYGQYTRQLVASALDRINVARLVIYLRRLFATLAKPYVFEPNDTITRNELKGHADTLLLELVSQRALYDFITVCDTTNNPPAVIDASELYLDVAIEPVKAAEFIYIPIRLENTGAIKALGAAAATGTA